MSYEYFLKFENSDNLLLESDEFFNYFKDNPYAFFKNNKEIEFKESLDPDYPSTEFCDAKLIWEKEQFIIQVNRRCNNLYELFKKSLDGKKYSINEEDDDEMLSLEAVFRQK